MMLSHSVEAAAAAALFAHAALLRTLIEKGLLTKVEAATSIRNAATLIPADHMLRPAVVACMKDFWPGYAVQ